MSSKQPTGAGGQGRGASSGRSNGPGGRGTGGRADQGRPGGTPNRNGRAGTTTQGRSGANRAAGPKTAGNRQITGREAVRGSGRGPQGGGRPGRPGSGRPAPAAPGGLRRLSTTAWGLIATGVVVLVVVVMIIVTTTGGGTPSTTVGTVPPSGRETLPTSITGALAGISFSELDKVGVSAIGSPPQKIKGGHPVSIGGHPAVVFVGAEYCPYCAFERWGLTIALDKFGSFSNLQGTWSSDSDVYPHTPTLSFYGATYSSPYITFSSTEEYDRNINSTTNYYNPLQSPTKQVSAIFKKYDASPYTQTSGSYPFVFFGDAVQIGSSGDAAAQNAMSGLNQADIVNLLKDPTNQVTKEILGVANLFIANICHMDGGQPANVCSQPAVQTALKKMGFK